MRASRSESIKHLCCIIQQWGELVCSWTSFARDKSFSVFNKLGPVPSVSLWIGCISEMVPGSTRKLITELSKPPCMQYGDDEMRWLESFSQGFSLEYRKEAAGREEKTHGWFCWKRSKWKRSWAFPCPVLPWVESVCRMSHPTPNSLFQLELSNAILTTKQ